MDFSINSDSYRYYCEANIHTNTKVILLSALLQGLTLDEVINQNLLPDLTISNISRQYFQCQKQLREKGVI